MKIRSGFVSNSSSSSFTCDVCGRTESGWDASLREFGMVECVKGHIFCEEHLLAEVEVEKHNENNEDDEEEEEDGYEVAEKRCPLCSLTVVSDNNLLTYLLKKQNLKEEDITAKIKEEFGTYSNFKQYLKEKD
jgi:hypothetical protein